MQISRRGFLGATLIGATAGVLAACGNGDDSSSSETQLRLLGVEDPLIVAALRELGEAYSAQTDGRVAVELETVPFADLYNRVQTGVAGGARWDVIMADGPIMKNYIYHEVLAPIGEFFDEEDFAQWDESLIANATHKDQFYGPPMQQYALAMMYNRQFLPAGVEPPTTLESAWTWDEAREIFAASTVRSSPDATPSVWGFWPSQGNQHPSEANVGLFRREAGKVGSPTRESIAPDGVTVSGYVNTEEAISAYEWLQSLVKDGSVAPDPLPDMFTQNQLAFVMAPDTALSQYLAANPGEEDRIGVTPLPVAPEGDPLTHIGSYHWGVLSNSENIEQAADFAKYAASLDGARILYKNMGRLPANRDLIPELEEFAPGGKLELYPKLIEEWGAPRIETPGYTEFANLHQRAMGDLHHGANVRELINNLAAETDRAMAQYAGWKD